MARGRPIFARKQVGHVAAFKQEKIGAEIQHPFQRAIEAAAYGAGAVDEGAAVGRVGANGAADIRHEAS